MSTNRERLKEIARQHLTAVKRDRKSLGEQFPPEEKVRGWNIREGKTYIADLFGLEQLLEYTHTHLAPEVLYIGETIGKAPRDIHETTIGENLNYHVTALRRYPQLQQTVGNERIIQTSAEQLKHVDSNSIGAIISDYALCYTDPQLAIQQIDRVLQQGGVLKASFDGRDASGVTGFKKADEFENELRARGYDIAAHEILQTTPIPPNMPEAVAQKLFPNGLPKDLNQTTSVRTILLAIKPPAINNITAQHLLDADMATYEKQLQQFSTQ
jgi:SAM-dependent methyltransferase